MSKETIYMFTCEGCCYAYESTVNHCPECGNEDCDVGWEVERNLEEELDELKSQVSLLVNAVRFISSGPENLAASRIIEELNL